MAYFVLEPEVAGGLGPHTVMDRSVHPPVVTKLHYVFDGWLGDEIVESFPCFIVTVSLLEKLEDARLTGFEVDELEVSASDEFRDLLPETVLPKFVWLKVVGTAGMADVGMSRDHRLVVSDAAMRIIADTAPRGLSAEPFVG